MNEITRIHIAKTAYDIEIAAKKQLEKYIKSLEAYTQDKDVLADVEIRMTELLTERGVAPGGVISSDDIAALRTQLGEPYEFADGEGDIAVGSSVEGAGRRFYRSTDNAVLGGVLSGIAAYFNVSPLWTRLVFILLLFISFGFATVIYIVLWIIMPPARTATDKLRMVGKDVTIESIKELNADEERAPENRVAPALQQIFSITFGSLSALAALGVFATTVWAVVAALAFNGSLFDMTNGFVGLGSENAWLVWLLFWIVVFGLLLLTALFSLIAYAFFAKKLTKKMVISGIVIIVLGISSVATVVGVGSTQSLRVASESRSLVRETKANLPKEFANVTSAKLIVKTDQASMNQADYFAQYASIRYVVDGGPARYELSALPTAKVVVATEGKAAEISLEVPVSFRNSFVQPVLTVYGPALTTVSVDAKSSGAEFSYDGTTQPELTVHSPGRYASSHIGGSFDKVTVKGTGSVDLSSGTVALLTVEADQELVVTAGTVRELSVTQPDVCPSGTYAGSTSVTVAGVTSEKFLYNGESLPAKTHRTSCAQVTIEPSEDEYGTY